MTRPPALPQARNNGDINAMQIEPSKSVSAQPTSISPTVAHGPMIA